MKNINELKQERSGIMQELAGILEIANAEDRNLSDVEETQYNELEKKVKDLDTRIRNAEKLAEIRKAAASQEINKRQAQPKQSEETKIKKRYSFLKAVRSQLPNERLDGVELEMHQEAVREARDSGISIQGVGVPAFFMEKRDLDVTNATAGPELVQTSVGRLIPALRPRLTTQALGATMLTGLRGDLSLPKHTGVISGTWEGEDDANAESTPTFGSVSLSPKRVGAYTEVTKQLIFQAENESVENLVRRDMEMAISIAVDSAAINGSGSGGQPTGILNTGSIGDVAGGTNGANPDWADLVDLESDVAVANADMGALAYLTTPGVRGYLKKTLLDSGSGLFIWPNDQMPNGYRAEVSTQVPSTLDKGTSTGVCHAIIFGNWQELIIANWAGVDLIIDPYSLATNAKIKLVVNSWWDIGVRHPESFSAMQDALIS